MDVRAVIVVGRGPCDLAVLGGLPVLARAVRALLDGGAVDNLTVLAPADRHERVGELCAGLPVRIAQVDGEGRPGDVVVRHEAAWALVPAAQIAAVVGAARSGAEVVVPVVALTDTVKQVDAAGRLTDGPLRETLRVIQSPVAFRDVSWADLPGPAEVLRRRCGPVATVPGDPMAFPLRTAADLLLAEAVLTS